MFDLYKYILNMTKNKHKPDLHSFIAKTKVGDVLFVEARDDGVSISVNGKIEFVGTPIAACNRLEEIYNIDVSTIEM